MLNSFKLLILSLFLFAAMVGLENALAAPAGQESTRLFPYSADGLSYGYVDATGSWVIEPAFDFAANFAEGLAVVEQAGQYGYIDESGQLAVEPQFDFATDFSFGLAAVSSDDKYGYIDPSGQIVIEPQFDDAQPFTADGLAAVRQDGLYGYIDQAGQMVIEPQFTAAFNFAEGLAAVAANGTYGYIDPTGQMVITPQFDFSHQFAEDLAAVLIDGKVGFINKEGEVVIEPTYDFAHNFSEGLAVVSLGGAVGYIDPSGQMVIAPQFDFAESFSEGLAAVREDDLIGFIDPAGQMVIEPQFDDAGPFQDGLARVERSYLWTAIDQTGAPQFLLPVATANTEATLVIPFLPAVPAETRDGMCLGPSENISGSFAWRCVVEADRPHQISIFDPCLAADNGRTLVCGANPLSGNPGFSLNLLEPLPEAETTEEDTAGVWLAQLPDGAVCHFALGAAPTIDGQRANYTCSDGSVLVGDIEPGTVWQANRVALADISMGEDGHTAVQIQPTEIAVIWQPVDPAATFEATGLSSYQLSIDPAGVADTVIPQIRPAVPYVAEHSSKLDGEPAHLRFTFARDDSPQTHGVSAHEAQLRIYPVEAYEAIYQDAEVNELSQRLEALQTLLQERPEAPEGEVPVLSGFDDTSQHLAAKIKYLDFAGGSGVRFITHYGMGATPITDHGTFYTFQGLTDDGQYYVAYYHPIPTALLPADYEAIVDLIDNDHEAFTANFATYVQELTDQLNGADDTMFEPGLSAIDTMLESLQIQPQ